MDKTIENLGLVGLIIQTCDNNSIVGRKRLQKMIYFTEYLGWDAGDFSLHLYGPYSLQLTDTLHIGKLSSIYDEIKHEGPYEYKLTQKGELFMKRFKKDFCNDVKLKRTQKLLDNLNSWETSDLELASTIDYVSKTEKMNEKQLLLAVAEIKDGFSMSKIKIAYRKWLDLKPLISA